MDWKEIQEQPRDVINKHYREDYLGKVPNVAKYVPELSLQERDRRWQMIREQMESWDVDCLLAWGSDSQIGLCEVNFRYITAIPCTMGRCLVIFPRVGEPIAFCGTPHDNWEGTVCHTWVKDVRKYPEANEVIEEIRKMGCESSRIGYVGDMRHYWPFCLQYQVWTDILKGLPNATFLEATSLLWPVQLIKSQEEIETMRKCAAIAKKVIEAIVNTAKPGVMECEVYAEMIRALIANGGEPSSMVLFDSGNPVFPHAKHPPMTMRPLEAGDMMVTEFHSKYAGMQTHTERTLSLGTPCKEVSKMFEAVRESYDNALAAMKPGNTLRQVVEALREPIHRNNLVYFECGLHPHGSTSGGWMDYNENDSQLDHAENLIIRENMIFSHQIDVFDPNVSRGHGVMLGDAFLVTKDGGKVFIDVPAEIIVI